MKQSLIISATAIVLAATAARAQSEHGHLHVNPRWKECSFQIDASLTQSAWHQFTQEAGLVTFFRPMSDARPMGKGRFELSVLQWRTGIHDEDAAWNDTFVHPDSTHWLFEGDALQFPGLMTRVGVSEKTDVGLYFTKNPNANYGFYGAQVQRALIGGATTPWSTAARVSFVSIYGPEDIDFAVYGAELITSRKVDLGRRLSLSPYAGVSGFLSRSHEKTPVVSLNDEQAGGAQATLGAALQFTRLRLGTEYSMAKVRSLSMKVGVGF
jgi:hypothetical protein